MYNSRRAGQIEVQGTFMIPQIIVANARIASRLSRRVDYRERAVGIRTHDVVPTGHLA